MDKEDTETKGEGSTVRAVDRAIAILQCFSADRPALSVLEIQRRVGLSRPTLYRLLQTLAATGLVKAEGDPQRFRLAHGVMELAHVWLAGLSKVDVARPILEALRESTGETAALFVLREQKRICVLELESHHALTIVRGVGDAGVITVGAIALAAPTFNHNGEVTGCIGVFGPKARVKDSDIPRFGTLVMQAANAISLQFGYRAGPDARGKPARSRRERGVA